MPTDSRQRGSALQQLHCPLQCVAGVALPTAPEDCGSALHELHCPLPPSGEAPNDKSSTTQPTAPKQ